MEVIASTASTDQVLDNSRFTEMVGNSEFTNSRALVQQRIKQPAIERSPAYTNNYKSPAYKKVTRRFRSSKITLSSIN